MESKQKIKIFLASSSELIEDRNLFEILIERKNKIWSKVNRPYLDLYKWEIVTEIVSATRKQDDYNLFINNADVLIILLWTKAGKYTLEEYKQARKKFLETGKPNIIIYQRTSEHIEDNLKEFLSYLNQPNREHFFSTYDTFSELESRFLNEIDHYISRYSISLSSPKEKIRNELLEGLEARYKARFKKRMHDETNFHLELKLEYTNEGTSDIFINDYYIDNYEINSSKALNELLYEFEVNLKRILILGQPGSGKTVLLLFFALKLIRKAKLDFEYPIPIILNLATWRKECENFDVWLVDNLVFAAGAYGTSKKYAKELTKDYNLLLLLDGLDEVPEAERSSCLKALWEYFKKNENANLQYAHYPQAIICSRKTEYLILPEDAPVRASLSISTLEPAYVIEKLALLKKDNTSAKILLNRINENTKLAEELDTVFKLHLALSISPILDFNNFNLDYLLKSYIENELTKVNGFNKIESTRYLSYLANQLKNKKKAITFEMTDIQPDWISNPYFYYFLFCFIYSCFASIFWSSILHLIFLKTTHSFSTFLPYIFSAFLLLEFFTLKRKQKIITKEIRYVYFVDFQVGKFLRELFVSSRIWILVFYSFDILLLIAAYLIDSNKADTLLIDFYKENGALRFIKEVLYVFGRQALVVLIPKAIFKLWRENIKVKRYPNIKKAYQRLLRPAIFTFFKLFIASTLFFLYLADFSNKHYKKEELLMLLMGYIFFSTIISTFFAIISSPLFKHVILRLFLLCKRKVPLRFRTFLNRVSKTGLMEKDGGQWRFRHQLIQDYFSEY